MTHDPLIVAVIWASTTVLTYYCGYFDGYRRGYRKTWEKVEWMITLYKNAKATGSSISSAATTDRGRAGTG